jgi:hypothetical protein
MRGRAFLGSALLCASLCLLGASNALAGNTTGEAAVQLPAAGELTIPTVVARMAPNAQAKRVLVLHQFRSDYRFQEVLAIASMHVDGELWYRLNLPMRPNGSTGWVPASQIDVRHMDRRIVVNINERKLQLFQGSKVLYTTTVAVGRPGMETPTGHFYVQVAFHPDDTFLGVWAFETSAYSKLTEWPGGGVVGIHGTSAPWLLGQAVSHGCVRMSNTAATALKKLVQVGTPITIVQG